MLHTQDLTFAYPKSETLQFPDIICGKDDHLLLLGPSGSGKTTLLHLLGGLLSPRSGRIDIDGINMASLSASSLDKFRGQNIGIIFQKPHFLRALTVEENLTATRRMARLEANAQQIRDLLERLGVGHKIKEKPDRLSVGEQQRVAIARALVNDPKILLADEPTSALDDTNCEKVTELLTQRAQEVGANLLIVTHDNRLKDLFANQIHL